MSWKVPGLGTPSRPTFIEWSADNINWIKITDHNRAPLDVSIERIENAKRMANGTLRKNVIAEKHTFSISWSEVPNHNSYTVDGGIGGLEIYDFYLENKNRFYMKVTQKLDPDTVGNIQTYEVMFAESCSFSVIKRNPSASTPYMLMDISLSLQEV